MRARALNERSSTNGEGYSKAFANFVEASDDVEGLLAYALYKRTINERRSLGISDNNGKRDPQKQEIEIYRTQAARYLEAFGTTVIEAERANIIAQGVQESTFELSRKLDGLSREITREVKASTGFWWPGVVVGVVAWLISIVLTILVVFAAPDWVTAWVRHLASR